MILIPFPLQLQFFSSTRQVEKLLKSCPFETTSIAFASISRVESEKRRFGTPFPRTFSPGPFLPGPFFRDHFFWDHFFRGRALSGTCSGTFFHKELQLQEKLVPQFIYDVIEVTVTETNVFDFDQ